MNTRNPSIPLMFALAGLFMINDVARADRINDMEFSLFVPYLDSKTIDFEGGADAELTNDAGFGIGFGYHFTERLAGRADIFWNSTNYNATRVLDDGIGTRQKHGGRLDTASLAASVDYYLTESRFSPYISANLGWTSVDSNIAAGRPVDLCWWDPWWGYICGTSQPTYQEDYFFYGAGLGARFDISRSNFIRLGYYRRWFDTDESSGTPSFDSFRFEFGFSY